VHEMLVDQDSMLLTKQEMGKFCHTQFLFLFAVFIA